MRRLITVVIGLFLLINIFAQNNGYKQIEGTFEGRHHMVSPDELHKKNFNLKNFEATDPPQGIPRSIAEFEPNQGVIIRGWLFQNQAVFGIPGSLIVLMSEHVIVYVICNNSDEEDIITSAFVNAGVNMDNIEFVHAPSDSYWTRDFSPWFIEYGNKEVGIVNFPYNRPRPDDDNIPIVFGNYFDMEVFGMALEHTGGNYMTTGMGTAASCNLVYEENQHLTGDEIRDLVNSFMGVTDYHLVNDPLDEYIQHIDCWGKFLSPDKIIITEVPPSDHRYDDFEAMADYWANQTSPYGNKFKVYRAYSPNGQPYTNSLILNNRVYVPIVSGTGAQYNADALQVYQDAMQGYEIIGVEGHQYFVWQTTDALHCRTAQVPDFEMLRIYHYPILDTVEYQYSYNINAMVYSLSSNEDMNEQVNIYYRINDNEFQNANMTNGGNTNFEYTFEGLNKGDKVCYYIQASNSMDKVEFHPYIGEHAPHCFVIQGEGNYVQSQNIANIQVYPNPVYNRLTITTNSLPADSYTIKIVDNNGKTVQKESFTINHTWDMYRINISELPSGLYILRLIGSVDSYSERFIKL